VSEQLRPHLLKLSQTSFARTIPHTPRSTLRSIDDVIAVGRGLCEAMQRLQDMSVAANSTRLIETIAWVITVAIGFGATDDMLLDVRLYCPMIRLIEPQIFDNFCD
jgi:hypothetical protein